MNQSEPVNPFTSTAPLSQGHPLFYGRDHLLQQLEKACSENSDRIILVQGGRKSGNTSVISRLQARLDKPPEVFACRINFQKSLNNTPYQELVQQIKNRISRNYNEVKASDLISFLEHVLSEAQQVNRFIFLIDGLHELSDDKCEELCKMLRALHSGRVDNPTLAKVQVVITGGIEIEALQDICSIYPLNDLSRDEAALLIANGLSEFGLNRPDVDTLAEAVYEHVRGHPYLTQRLGELLTEQYLKGETIGKTTVEQLAWDLVNDSGSSSLIAPLQKSINKGHLKAVAQIKAVAQNLITNQRSEAPDETGKAELLGLVHRSGNYCELRNPLLGVALAKWIGYHIPGGRSVVDALIAIRRQLPIPEHLKSTVKQYLERLQESFANLPSDGFTKCQPTLKLPLSKLYLPLAVCSYNEITKGPEESLTEYVTFYFPEASSTKEKIYEIKDEYTPEKSLPDRAVVKIEPVEDEYINKINIDQVKKPRWALYRNMLATEAIKEHQRFVLLGDLGSGKSTFVHRLAWALACHHLDSDDTSLDFHLWGWDKDTRPLPLPIIVPFRTLAREDFSHESPQQAILNALHKSLDNRQAQTSLDLLNHVLHDGTALIVFDGVDEVPLLDDRASRNWEGADRLKVLEVINTFTKTYNKVRVLVTCRTHAFTRKERKNLPGWTEERLAPLTVGQIRYFVNAWCRLTGEQRIQSDLISEHFIKTIVDISELQELVKTPFLLMLMAVEVSYNKLQLPRDRARFYDQVLEWLLSRWDEVRGLPGISQSIQLPDWDINRFRLLVDRLSRSSYGESHEGKLPIKLLQETVLAFFRNQGVDSPGTKLDLWLSYIEQRTEIIKKDDSDLNIFYFTNLIIRKFCTARHIVTDPKTSELSRVDAILDPPRDIFHFDILVLAAGLFKEQIYLEKILSDLLENRRNRRGKRKYLDFMLAAEIGADKNWEDLTKSDPVFKNLKKTLIRRICELLSDDNQPLSVNNRLHVAKLLSKMGDPRFPVSIQGSGADASWRTSLGQVFKEDFRKYFRRVEAGNYTVGSQTENLDVDCLELPLQMIEIQRPFFIGKFPITNAQWHEWVKAGGQASPFANQEHRNLPNQPVTGITWHDANNFCLWLSKELGLSEELGKTIRLPTEEEWEVAARGLDKRHYPWGTTWQDDRAASAEDRNNRVTSNEDWAVPVGCYPAGSAPCGAQDMAGNVWEWTSSLWLADPEHMDDAPLEESDEGTMRRILRGGSFLSSKKELQCSCRLRLRPDSSNDADGVGFRIVLVLPEGQ